MRYCGLPGIEVDGGLALVFEPLAGTPPTTFFFFGGEKRERSRKREKYPTLHLQCTSITHSCLP